jgi:hypothetical protein
MPLALDILLRIALAIQGTMCFHMYFRIDFYVSVNNVIGILVGTPLHMYIVAVTMAIFTMFILPIQKYGRNFHPLMSSQFLSSVVCSFN